MQTLRTVVHFSFDTAAGFFYSGSIAIALAAAAFIITQTLAIGLAVAAASFVVISGIWSHTLWRMHRANS
jgi:hypothetical protein